MTFHNCTVQADDPQGMRVDLMGEAIIECDYCGTTTVMDRGDIVKHSGRKPWLFRCQSCKPERPENDCRD